MDRSKVETRGKQIFLNESSLPQLLDFILMPADNALCQRILFGNVLHPFNPNEFVIHHDA